jgi:ubiquinone/menaquinone biosynthesis C-methylase UbiE
MTERRPTMGRATYIHGTEAAEQERLVALNRLTNPAFIRFLDVRPGSRVLDVGSGLGILAGAVARAAPGVRVTGIELSAAQVGRAERPASVAYVRGDAHALAFMTASFDLVYARYLLEHAGDPAAVLAEMFRVLRPGGRVAVMENDVSLVRFDPPCSAFEDVWAAFTELQHRLGGDGLVGRRLFRLLTAAGFDDVRLSVQPEVHWFGSPDWVTWIVNIIGNVESARRALVDSGLASRAAIDGAVGELSALAHRPDGSATFVWNRATGTRKALGTVFGKA